jgi:hypothetical protein
LAILECLVDLSFLSLFPLLLYTCCSPGLSCILCWVSMLVLSLLPIIILDPWHFAPSTHNFFFLQTTVCSRRSTLWGMSHLDWGSPSPCKYL